MRVVKQRRDWDCGLACLAMLLDKDYGDIREAQRRLIPVVPKRGFGILHLQTIAGDFHTPLTPVYKSKTYLLDYAEGVLGMNGGHIAWPGHWVIWKEGCILEPWHEKHAVFGLEEYLKMNKCRTATLLVRR